MIDADGNNLYVGQKVAAADNIDGIRIKIGKVIGFTDQRVRIDWGL